MDSDESNFDPVLINTFLVNNKRNRVYFHRNVLIWEGESAPVVRNTVPITDVIWVDFQHGLNCNCTNATSKDWSTSLDTFHENENTQKHNGLVVNYAAPAKNNKWRIQKVIFQHSDPLQVSSWLITLKNSLTNQSGRPKSILAFINPFGGKRKGLKIYKKHVEPIMKIANVRMNPVVTQYKNHAKEIILNSNLDDYDSILLIGGDGTVAEVVNALILRTMKANNIETNNPDAIIPEVTIPVSIIPGGSTDCIAYCVNGNSDRQTAVIFTVLGDRVGLDVSSLHTNNDLVRYYLSLMCYGFLGDLLKESDKYRWMGPKRYEYAGFKTVLRNKGYQCEVNLKVAKDEYSKHICKENCHQCNDKRNELKQQQRYKEDFLQLIKGKLNQNVKLSEEYTIEKISGKFLAVASANISCACDRSPNGFSPYSHIGNGSIDIIIIEHGSIFRILRFLTKASSKSLKQSICDLPFVKIYRVKEFNIKPINDCDKSVWNCDGEVIDEPSMNIKCHRQLVNVFGRRPQDSIAEAKKLQTSCFSCCSK